jgi:hypothetical protein
MSSGKYLIVKHTPTDCNKEWMAAWSNKTNYERQGYELSKVEVTREHRNRDDKEQDMPRI